ncbi:MAG: transketolase [Gammaproteobacteria bacterium]
MPEIRTVESLRESANAIRVLSMDAVQQANSGHPGMPMGMADIATVLWQEFIQHNPQNPNWPNRDRFILSNGHGSMLQYALLHLTGYSLTMEDLKQFRQFGSKTPGHPEYGYTPGVEVTTGPLGQGLAMGVGMALAERTLAATFNRPDYDLINHFTYVFLGDGCLMEGISHEACSLAGTLKLGKLIAFWDDNGISIDGEVQGWFTEDIPARFRAYGWHVVDGVDGHNPAAIRAAIETARTLVDKPSLICCKTIIGFGAPKVAGTESVHGAPLGSEVIQNTRKALNWPYDPFVIPAEIYQAWDARVQGAKVEQNWQQRFDAYVKSYPELAQELQRRLSGKLPADWQQHADAIIHKMQAEPSAMASRKASHRCIQAYAQYLPELYGGSADLTGSNLTHWPGSATASAANPAGNYLHYGVREFAMAAVMNGMALYGGFIPFGGTFLVFADYARNALRLSAIQKLRVIYVFTHDSIGLGEDGPTHQPIEHIATLRLTPNISVWRPCDAAETAVAWRAAIEHSDGPTCLALSRQNLPPQPRTSDQIANIARGGYILFENSTNPEIILIATGSEVALAMQAAQVLVSEGRNIRVVTMPSVDVFLKQDETYRRSVLPPEVKKRVAIEAGIRDYWYRFVGEEGAIIGLDSFGESAPAEVLFKHFGFTVENVVATVKGLL